MDFLTFLISVLTVVIFLLGIGTIFILDALEKIEKKIDEIKAKLPQ